MSPAPGWAQQPKPPLARTIARADTLHGEVRVDNYLWLREKTNPEVIAYLEAENSYLADISDGVGMIASGSRRTEMRGCRSQ